MAPAGMTTLPHAHRDVRTLEVAHPRESESQILPLKKHSVNANVELFFAGLPV